MSVLMPAFVLQLAGLHRHSLLGVSGPSTCQNLGEYQSLLGTLAVSWHPGVPVSAFHDWILEELVSSFGLLKLMSLLILAGFARS